MSARRWKEVAGVVALAALAGVLCVRLGGDRAVDRAAPGRVVASTPSPSSPPVVSPSRPRLDDEPAEVAADVAVVASPRIDGVTFASAYARDMCACSDGACIDAVNERHGGRLGSARATRDARAVSAEFRRAMECARRIRAL